MTLKEIAKLFGVNVRELATLMGYSHQGLYDIIHGKGKENLNQKRLYVSLQLLESKNKELHDQDIAKANMQGELRRKAIQELAEKANIRFELEE